MLADLSIIFQWWGTLFLVGAAAYPLTRRLFRNWFDSGYLFAKAVGLATVTYIVYLLGVLHIAPFVQVTVWGAMGAIFILGVLVNRKDKKDTEDTKKKILLMVAEEVFFFSALLFWSWVKAHEPSIHSLEKFMDFGFTKSILDSTFFPAPDMWYAGGTINYYYFGHTVMAVLTRISGIDLTTTFNLMLATIFAFCFTMSFSIGKQLTKKIGGGVLTAFLTTLAGNMQTLYAFTQGYDGDKVQPFWKLLWPIGEFISRLPDGLNRYWYANATRFIPYTIHEFPSYSFVVSDVHGHVLSIPFVLLALGLLISFFGTREFREVKKNWLMLVFYGFLCSVLLMTNALDGPIYLGLFLILLALHTAQWRIMNWKKVAITAGGVISIAGVVSLPFLLHFKSFVSGIAVNCPPAALADTKFGPLLFESVEKCQHSPLWMMWILWGFFIYCGGWLVASIINVEFLFSNHVRKLYVSLKSKTPVHETLLLILFVFSIALIIFPEFFYFKDIYPMHFRSNTMFKLGYDAFIMFSIVAGYTIVKMLRNKIFLLLLVPQLLLVSIYPIFSVRSYFNSLRNYEGINGIGWIASQYPDDWAGITWLNTHASGVIVEADGDSYTDYNQVSAFTGLPTIVGWSVHEWLWRGSYDVVAPRKEEVRRIYESTDLNETKQILEKYHVTYIFVGTLERQKFTNLAESKFSILGKPVFTSGQTVIYEVH
jgi:YYY domain-containing protein